MEKGGASSDENPPFLYPVMIFWDMTSVPFSKEALANARERLPTLCPCRVYTYITLAISGDIAALPDSDKAVIFNDMVPKYIHPPEECEEEMICHMKWWAKSVPPPSNYMVLTGKQIFLPTLKELQRQKYNIILAHPDGNYPELVEHANIAWKMSDLISGRDPYYVREPVPDSLDKKGKRRRRRRRKAEERNKKKLQPIQLDPLDWSDITFDYILYGRQ